MKVLVVGSVPPPTGGHRSSLLAKVLETRSSGDDLEVVALDRLAAAHSYLPGPGIAALLAAFRRTRRADAVIWQVEPGLPVRGSAGRLERALCLFGLAALLRLGPPATLRFDHLDDLPGGFGGRAAVEVWRRAARIEAGDDRVVAALEPIVAGSPASLVAPPPEGDGSGAASLDSSWADAAALTADDVVSVVRRRAAAERARLAASGRLPAASADHRTRVQQWQWLPAPGAGVPDLGPVSSGAPAAAPAGLRRVALPVLAAAERYPVSRAAARGLVSGYRAARRSVRALSG